MVRYSQDKTNEESKQASRTVKMAEVKLSRVAPVDEAPTHTRIQSFTEVLVRVMRSRRSPE